MQDDESITNIIVFTIARLIIIFILFMFIFAVAKIIQNIIGKEYVMEEEIVIVHEHTTKEDAIKAQEQHLKEGKTIIEPISSTGNNANTNTSSTTRGKKQKSS